MQVWVTRDDIERGVPVSGRGCPIARALNRALPRVAYVYVNSLGITIGRRSEYYQDCTDEQRRFILDFDKGRAVDPIMIEIPDEKEE